MSSHKTDNMYSPLHEIRGGGNNGGEDPTSMLFPHHSHHHHTSSTTPPSSSSSSNNSNERDDHKHPFENDLMGMNYMGGPPSFIQPEHQPTSPSRGILSSTDIPLLHSPLPSPPGNSSSSSGGNLSSDYYQKHNDGMKQNKKK